MNSKKEPRGFQMLYEKFNCIQVEIYCDITEYTDGIWSHNG